MALKQRTTMWGIKAFSKRSQDELIFASAVGKLGKLNRHQLDEKSIFAKGTIPQIQVRREYEKERT